MKSHLKPLSKTSFLFSKLRRLETDGGLNGSVRSWSGLFCLLCFPASPVQSSFLFPSNLGFSLQLQPCSQHPRSNLFPYFLKKLPCLFRSSLFFFSFFLVRLCFFHAAQPHSVLFVCQLLCVCAPLPVAARPGPSFQSRVTASVCRVCA